MPITCPVDFCRIGQEEFGELAFEVMKNIFAIHNEFGKYFHESIYKRELASRVENVLLEVPITVSHKDFLKRYYLDVLLGGCGLFELKSVEAIHSRHRGQTMHYLLLTGLSHAKLINVHNEDVEHEFVNCNWRLCDNRNPDVHFVNWDKQVDGAESFVSVLLALISDWGAGLELACYNAALCHFLEGIVSIPVAGSLGTLGSQPMRMVSSDTAFKLTAFPKPESLLSLHTSRLIRKTGVKAILCANIIAGEIRFETIFP